MTDLTAYAGLLSTIKDRIRTAQTRAAFAVNAELIRLYWEIGCLLDRRQSEAGWGAGVIPSLARDLANELPEVKGFSSRNLDRMVAFARAYPQPKDFSPQPVAKTASVGMSPQAVANGSDDESLLWLVPWGHHALLLAKVGPLDVRTWYMRQVLALGWSRATLALQLDGRAHERQGRAVNNFAARLPPTQSDLAIETLKDPYVFDFLTLDAGFRERKLETGLIAHLERFLLELGQGFAFVGRQHHLIVGKGETARDFYIDLLFYHLKLRAYLVIELKRGDFKPEYAGKLNFYCNVVDETLRHADDAPTIGLILCQDKDNVLAEYALRGIDKPIGIASYELTRSLPTTLQSALPSIETIEAELLGLSASHPPATDSTE